MCRRCGAEHVPTDGRGLCRACALTDSLPGLEPQPWDLTLTNPEAFAKKANDQKHEQPTLF